MKFGFAEQVAIVLLFWLVAFMPLNGQGNAIRAQAVFDPPVITTHRESSYVITVSGTQQIAQPVLPKVPGLTFSEAPNVSQAFRSINGVSSISISLSYRVRPTRQGTFPMPAFSIKAQGKDQVIPTSSLQVLPPSQEDLRRAKLKRQQEENFRQALFLETSFDRSFLYEGETMPGKIDLYIQNHLPAVRVLKYPHMTTGTFSQSRIDGESKNQVQRTVTRNGKQYTKYSWPITITSLKQGMQEIQYAIVVSVRLRNRNPNTDPFLLDPLLGLGREHAIQAFSEKIAMEVKALPMEGQPASFEGAIGSFETEAKLKPQSVSMGNRVDLFLEITGTGNFEAIRAPSLNSSDQLRITWKNSTFEGDENLKQDGTKRFEYILYPKEPGLVEVPATPFTYFDPVAGRYFDKSIPVRKLKVLSEQTAANGTQLGSQANSENAATSNNEKQYEVKPNSGNWHLALIPSMSSAPPAFWYYQLIPLGGFVSMLGCLWFKNQKTRGNKSNRLAKTKRQLKQAARDNDAPGFFQAARQVIQLQVGSIVGHANPETLTSDEILGVLEGKELSTADCQEAQEALAIADTLEFSGKCDEELSLREWLSRMDKLLKKIRSLA